VVRLSELKRRPRRPLPHAFDLLVPRRRGLGLGALALTVAAATPPPRTKSPQGRHLGRQRRGEIFQVVKKVAAREGLTIELVTFNDYQLPNAALAAGDLDANAFQHQPFLDNQIKARGFDLVPVGLTVTAPLGFYSRRIKSIEALPEGASVGIQNDPSNGNRPCCCCSRPA
jgi:D-methionine transport system substrate-binding protein